MTKSKRIVRVITVDDHEIVRVGIEALLNNQPGIALVGQGKSGAELYELLTTFGVDVLLLDVHMPNFDALTTVDLILKRYPDLKILLFTTESERLIIDGAIRKGVAGYVLKGENFSNVIVDAIFAVANGQKWFSPGTTEKLFRTPATSAELTIYELDVLRLLAEGFTPRQISHSVSKTLASVYQLISRLRVKLSAKDNQQLLAIAREKNFLPPHSTHSV